MNMTFDTSAPRRACGAPGPRRPKMPVPAQTWQPTVAEVQRHLDLAGEALLARLSRDHVVMALIGRIARDEHSLADRRACRKHTNYDMPVEADLRAIALAVC
jgi:hypothetical protein